MTTPALYKTVPGTSYPCSRETPRSIPELQQWKMSRLPGGLFITKGPGIESQTPGSRVHPAPVTKLCIHIIIVTFGIILSFAVCLWWSRRQTWKLADEMTTTPKKWNKKRNQTTLHLDDIKHISVTCYITWLILEVFSRHPIWNYL